MGIFTKISAIIPVYNVEKWVKDCLESVANQTKQFYEIILVNDGSTDQSAGICRNFAREYKNITYLEQHNKGLGAARNKALDNMKPCDYFLFLDSDDYLALDTVEKLQKELSNEELDGIYYNGNSFMDSEYVNSNDNVIADYMRFPELTTKSMSGEAFFYDAYPGGWDASVCFTLYKYSLIDRKKIRFHEGVLHEDHRFSIMFICEAEKVKYFPEAFYNRRYRNNSIMTNKLTDKNIIDFCSEQIAIIEYLRDRKYQYDNSARGLPRYLKDMAIHALCEAKRAVVTEDAIEKMNTWIKQFLSELLLLFDDLYTDNYFTNGYFSSDFALLDRIKKSELFELNEIRTFLKGYLVKVREFYKNEFKMLNSDEIYFYGIGKHSEGVLRIFEKVNEHNLVIKGFIQTKKDREAFLELPVISLDEFEEIGGKVFISSMKYRDEMRKAILELGIKIDVIDFYDSIKNDVFSCYGSIEWLL